MSKRRAVFYALGFFATLGLSIQLAVHLTSTPTLHQLHRQLQPHFQYHSDPAKHQASQHRLSTLTELFRCRPAARSLLLSVGQGATHPRPLALSDCAGTWRRPLRLYNAADAAAQACTKSQNWHFRAQSRMPSTAQTPDCRGSPRNALTVGPFQPRCEFDSHYGCVLLM